jgi:hypothetical protein
MSRAVVNPAVEYVGHVLDDPATALSTNARFVIAELARHWNRRSQTVWIAAGRYKDDGTPTGLVKTTRLSERAVRYALRELEAGGYIAAEPTRAGQSTAWSFPFLTRALELVTPAPGAGPAPGAPRHQVHPSVEWTPAPGAATPAPGAPTPAPGAYEPVEEPVRRTSALHAVPDVEALPYAVGQDSFTADDTGPMVISDQRIADVIARHYNGDLKVRQRPRRGPP